MIEALSFMEGILKMDMKKALMFAAGVIVVVAIAKKVPVVNQYI